MVASIDGPGNWVLLTYRLPREPSTPRIAVWRKLRRLGVAQLADGLVALPEDARTREQLEWTADEVLAAGGTAIVWHARPTTAAEERSIAARMAEERAEEYRALVAKAEEARSGGAAECRRALRSLRSELRAVRRRDYFSAPGRHAASAAVDALAAAATQSEETVAQSAAAVQSASAPPATETRKATAGGAR